MGDYSLAKNKFSQEKETFLYNTNKNCNVPATMVRMKTLQRLPSGPGPEAQVEGAMAEWKARTVSEGSAQDNRDGVLGPSVSFAKSDAIKAVETAYVGEKDYSEARRPPKKRKKNLQVSEREPVQSEGRGEGSTDERQEPSPSTIPKPINQNSSSSSAWETLMNVAALVPPLPTTTGKKPGSTSKAKSSPAKGSILDQPPCPDVIPNCQRWEEMFHRLEIYRQIHGHCRVPNRYPEDPSLGSWVATQRRYYKNTNLPMPEDRVGRLEALGFEWSTKDPRKVPWEQRFKDLEAFVARYGHSDVPHEWEECPQLGFWVANQRQQYRYLQLGKKSALNEERIKQLDAIGFVWKMQGGRRKKSDPVARKSDTSLSGRDTKPLLLDSMYGIKRKASDLPEIDYVPPRAVPMKGTPKAEV